MPALTLLLVEEVLDSAAVVAVVTSAVYWWKASHTSFAVLESSPEVRARLNAKAATHAAIAATVQAFAVMAHIIEVGRWF